MNGNSTILEENIPPEGGIDLNDDEEKTIKWEKEIRAHEKSIEKLQKNLKLAVDTQKWARNCLRDDFQSSLKRIMKSEEAIADIRHVFNRNSVIFI